MMAVAILDFRWTPDQFWAATPHEFYAAWELIEARNQRLNAG
jgi:hypothetical protein